MVSHSSSSRGKGKYCGYARELEIEFLLTYSWDKSETRDSSRGVSFFKCPVRIPPQRREWFLSQLAHP